MMFASASFAAFPADLRHMGPVARDGFATLATDLRHVFAILADAFAAFSANFRHVFAVLAHDFAALLSSLARFVGREFVRRTLFMSGSASLAGNGALFGALRTPKTPLRGRFALRRRLRLLPQPPGTRFFRMRFARL